MQRSDFRYLERLRVRWVEVDMQKIVFNGHYLMYFDTAVAGYWRALAMPYHETMERLAGDLFVRKATLEYLGSARYDDLCEVGIRCARLGRTSMLITAALFRDETCLVHGELVYVFADPATQTSQPMPPVLRQVLEDYEAGQPALQLRVGAWDALAADASALRKQVFVKELGIAAPLDADASDAACVHAVAYNGFGQAMGTGRLSAPDASGIGQIGRLAVHAGVRGSGVGAAILGALVDAARARGDTGLRLDAKVSAMAFYQRAGFAAHGAPFEESGVAHQTMRRSLP